MTTRIMITGFRNWYYPETADAVLDDEQGESHWLRSDEI